jgi:hypothetical protein
MQRQFNFIGMLKAPSNAPHSILSQITDAAQAIRVSISIKGLKLAYYAAEMHVSQAYISQIANGHRQVPEWFAEPFCCLTGSNLLKQYLHLQEALEAADGKQNQRAIDRHLADRLREVA